MGLFGKKKREFPPLISDDSTPIINFNSVTEYLEGLSHADYTKLLKVVDIYRAANKDVNKVLGIKNEPSVSITKESQDEAELEDDLGFILDDELAKPEKPKKIEVKD